MTQQHTICAIATGPSSGAIAIIRLSGSQAFEICGKLLKTSYRDKLFAAQANTLLFARLYDNEQMIDEVMLGIYRNPRSYTGEDMVEISCHGSKYIEQQILRLLIENGAQLASPGEFTQRAFLNGKMDLSQAEAVADLIASESAGAHKLAVNQLRGGFRFELELLRQQLLHFISLVELELDFSEEEVEFADREQLRTLIVNINNVLQNLANSFSYGNAIKSGIQVAIVGKPNSGKSTLLNALLNEEKAIVSDIAGTTRDVIEDVMTIDGISFRFMDTAGIRHTSDTIESIGIERTYQRIKHARIVLLMVEANDTSDMIAEQIASISLTQEQNLIVVVNKCDLADSSHQAIVAAFVKDLPHQSVFISAKQKMAIDSLKQLLVKSVNLSAEPQSDVIVTNIRHYEALVQALEAGQRAYEALQQNLPGDLMAQDIREMIYYLGSITGEISTDEVLGNIFKNFCIGK
jgi:tRNA modification GTPase